MSLRIALRRLRLYYKSLEYLRSIYGANAPLLRLPFRRKATTFNGPNGITLEIPPQHWRLLPSMTKLAEIGARTRAYADYKQIDIDGLSYCAPIEPRGEAVFFREIFQDDVYEVKALDLSGKIAVDIGAHIGDFTLFLARLGATVHAFEPSAACGRFLTQNAAANGLAERVVFHNVGLSNRDHDEQTDSADTLHFVEGAAYMEKSVPANVDFLKIDCEGCEYYLFDIPGLLEHMNAERIAMEFHHGAEPLASRLRDLGYTVRVSGDHGGVGYIHAQRGAAHA